MSREAMKLALDALVFAAYEDIEYDDACDQKVREARNALRQALSQPEQEPIAWMHTTGTGHVYYRKKPQDKVFNPQPVYTVPPRREWVELTEKEWYEATGIPRNATLPMPMLKSIEKALKEKNGG